MPEQMRPASKALAPDPANSYERTDPAREAGQGSLDTNTKATPTPRADSIATAVDNAQDGAKQINGSDEAVKNVAMDGKTVEKPK